MLGKSVSGKSVMATVLTVGICCVATSRVSAQDLRNSLQDLEVGERWTYNDWESAKAAAAKSKKPILALFR